MRMALNEDGLLDLVIDNGIARETGFATVILTSLLLNRRAGREDILPLGQREPAGGLPPDRRGWAGDALDDRGRLTGSRLWLLDRELATGETRQRAVEYVSEALQWLVDGGHVLRLNFRPEWASETRLDLGVDVVLAGGDVFSLSVNYESGAVHVV